MTPATASIARLRKQGFRTSVLVQLCHGPQVGAALEQLIELLAMTGSVL